MFRGVKAAYGTYWKERAELTIEDDSNPNREGSSDSREYIPGEDGESLL